MAVMLNIQRAPAYCLKAQIWPQLPGDYAKEEEEAWLQCLRYADQTNPDEDKWVGMARQYFSRPETEGGNPKNDGETA